MKNIVFLLLLSISSCFAVDNDAKYIKKQYFKSYDYEQMGKYSEAIKVLAPLYNKYPKGYTLNLRFGWLFYLNKNYNNAIKYYENASIINTYALDPKLGLIRIYLDTYSYTKAESISYQILKIDYYNYYANLYLIKSLIAQSKYDTAQKITVKMLNVYPTDVLYLEQLAIIYKYKKSPLLNQLYNDILILDPNNVYVRNKLN